MAQWTGNSTIHFTCNHKIAADFTLNGLLFVDNLTATDRTGMKFLSITNLSVSTAKMFLVNGSLVSKDVQGLYRYEEFVICLVLLSGVKLSSANEELMR